MTRPNLVFPVITTTWCLVFLKAGSSSPPPTAPALPPSNPCIAHERDALLGFKAGLQDPSNYLASWQGDKCCEWEGVVCSKRNGHVAMLTLQYAGIGGKISPSLLALRHLKAMNLEGNDFRGEPIPEFFGEFKNMQHLTLNDANFSGLIPPHLGNLSKLIDLEVTSYTDGPKLYSTNLAWLSRLTNLQYLGLDGVNLSTAFDWAHSLNMLPSLQHLSLGNCGLRNAIPPPLHMNLTSLEVIYLSANPFNSPVAVEKLFWPFWDFPSLETIDLESCGLQGILPEDMGNSTSLVNLNLNFNDLTGLPTTFKRLSNLKLLYLAQNNISGDIEKFLDKLPDNGLYVLELYGNNLEGSLPAQKGRLGSLYNLRISDNKISGNIPIWIGELTNLTNLELDSNNFNGVITQFHLANLARLKILGLSYNTLAIVADHNWVPPFKLMIASLKSCGLGPKFPGWLRSQDTITMMDILNTSIADSIPDWFWTTFSNTEYFVLSGNKISGVLPATMNEKMAAEVMDFSNNLLEGQLQKVPENLTYLDLSKNNLSGSLPLDFGAPFLESLILFENSLSGKIPQSFCQLKHLEFVDLSANLLPGPFPNCLNISQAGNTSRADLLGVHQSMMSNIIMLNLNDNNLSGTFPLFLQKCQNLIFLDLAFNRFSGSLPAWIDELSTLALLRLRSNMFTGEIPPQLTKMKELQYLDLAYNSFSGTIPWSLVNLMAMSHRPADNDSLSYIVYYGWSLSTPHVEAFMFANVGPYNFEESGPDFSLIASVTNESLLVVTKGQQLEFRSGIIYMVNFDLSCNNLTGHIPENISMLTALKNLNLSWNHLSGVIPTNIGALQSIESLDLSHNELSGQIPTSLSAPASLSHLNLSYNNLSGPIPYGNQLRTLDEQASIYIGNPGLCGPPLSRNCSESPKLLPGAIDEDKSLSDGVFLYLGMGIGWVVGLWVVFCTFLFMHRWRIICFLVSDRLYDRIYLHLTTIRASFTKQSGRN
uniref:non-specific serine/threonine protein kinase n=1 Tax=Oryza punctata TaxID=4537 RepID=A0A0E0LKC6_ORYPU